MEQPVGPFVGFNGTTNWFMFKFDESLHISVPPVMSLLEAAEKAVSHIFTLLSANLPLYKNTAPLLEVWTPTTLLNDRVCCLSLPLLIK